MKSQDIVILLKLASLNSEEVHGPHDPRDTAQGREDPYSVRGLEAALGISKSEVNASLNRSVASGLAVKDRERRRTRPNRRNLHDFIVHGLKFVFPAKPGAMSRGIPTAFAAPMLESRLASAGEYIFVWPDAEAKEMGQSIAPLFRSVPEAVRKDVRLYEYLALVDAIRLGRQRQTNIAIERLTEMLLTE